VAINITASTHSRAHQRLIAAYAVTARNALVARNNNIAASLALKRVSMACYLAAAAATASARNSAAQHGIEKSYLYHRVTRCWRCAPVAGETCRIALSSMA